MTKARPRGRTILSVSGQVNFVLARMKTRKRGALLWLTTAWLLTTLRSVQGQSTPELLLLHSAVIGTKELLSMAPLLYCQHLWGEKGTTC